MQRQVIRKMIGNSPDWLFYADGTLIKVADSTGLTVSILNWYKILTGDRRW